MVKNETGAGDLLGKLAMQFGVAEFGNRTAFGTDHQNVMPVTGGVHAGSPRIDGVKPVDQAFSNKEVKRPVNRGRCRPGLDFTNFVEQFVGLHAALALQQDFKHFATNGRQAPSALGTQ